jgi:Ca-activated chloride channel family protein
MRCNNERRMWSKNIRGKNRATLENGREQAAWFMTWSQRTTKCLVTMLLLPLLCSATIRWQGKKASSNARNAALKIDVDLVLVNATVSDSQGRMVTNLERENFQLWEDKVEQKIEHLSHEDTPFTIGLIFDATRSMSDKISTARDAAVTFLKTGNPEDDYFLVTFSQNAQLAEDFTTDISRLQNRLLLTRPDGLTPLFDAVHLGLEKMRSASNKRKTLLLITDGEDNNSRYSFSDVKEFAKESDVQIFAIGIMNPLGELERGKTGRSNIEDLVRITGGRAFFPHSVSELEDICAKIAIELRSQYVLGYHSTNGAKDGKWRKIRLKVIPPIGLRSLSVRGKNGYYAEKLEDVVAGFSRRSSH